MIEVFEYKKNQLSQIRMADISKDVAWIRIVDPDEEKIKALSDKTGIPLEELQESLEEEERPKVMTGRYVEIIYRAPIVERGDIITSSFYIYYLSNKVITIERDELTFLSDMSHKLKAGKGRYMFKKGLPFFVYHILDRANDDFLRKIEKISKQIDVYENISTKALSHKDIEKLYDQSVALTVFNRALIANVEVLNALRKTYSKKFTSEDKDMFNELYYDALHLLDMEKIQREVVNNLFNLQSVLASSRLNIFIKRLTALAFLVAIPTLISSIYGMNFRYIPLADHPYGFHISTAFIIGVTLGFIYLFNRLDWL